MRQLPKAYTRPVVGFGLMALTIALSCTGLFAQELKERKDVPDKYKWDLTDMYKTDADLERDLQAIEGMLPGLSAYKGKISQSPDDLFAYFKAMEPVHIKLDNAVGYAHMSYDQDTRVTKYSGYKDQVDNLASKVYESESWFIPELVTLTTETLEDWYKQKPELALYRQWIDNQLRTKQYTLSSREEELIAMAGPALHAVGNANTALRNTDIKFPTIKDDQGNDIEISEGRVAMLMENPNREVRRNAALGLLNTYIQYKNTASALMSGNVQSNMFNARAHGYNSALQASMDNENIDTTVYLNLLTTVKDHITPLQKYVELRRKALGIDSVHSYDMFAPLDESTTLKYTYEEAVAMLKTALKPLGTEYNKAMAKAFEDRWVDVYETAGKRSGAYSWGSYASHPYQMTNFNGTFDDMFTLGHELGHSMHTWHSSKAQPFIYADYTIFVAEVASTFNESLIMDYMIKRETDPKKKLYLVTQYIDQIRGTLITQVMFADFELKMYRAAEAGEPLTSEKLSELYLSTMQEFYGPRFAYDEQYAYTWIRIPHFYRNFYVYKYATSYSAAQGLSQRVLSGGDKELKAYLGFLSGGSSKYPLDLLRGAGVDMAKPDAIKAVMTKFEELVGQMESLMLQTGMMKG
ncbi:oligoendopeptidase F [candidate division KSB1 bacterium]|nr:oligoendopeptidase F [candidate division KSB1 bacterium]